jgi:tetratricopeptide (TPR) repeat protein
VQLPNAQKLSTMSLHYSQAIALNSQAASLMEAGNFGQASAILKEALTQAKIALLEDRSNDMENSTKTKTSLDYCMDHQSRFLINDETSMELRSSSSSFVYRRAMCIPLSMMKCCFDSRVLLSVLIMFNLALCYHLSAMESKSLAGLLKATRLYELAYKLQLDEKLDSNTLFTLTIVNNLGHLHALIGHTETSEKYFQHLLSVLMFIIVIDCNNNEEVAQLPVLEGFFYNTLHLILQDQTADAA